jgi:glycosyltransferase involved in cell wall biosynthesis
MKISIVTSYFNRKKLLINTLKSIKQTEFKNFEFIIVDDASNNDNKIDDLVYDFPFIKLIRIEPEDKWYINPCIPFNIGFKNITGDIVIIQNPECFHTSDIISFVAQNLKENDYFSFGCYSLSEEKTQSLTNDINSYQEFSYHNRSARFNGDDSWYNHSIFRPKGYHFASAIYKSKLDELNGFDERFANGYGYDDDEFLFRVNKMCNVKFIDKPLVLHQHHYNLSQMQNNSNDKLIVNNSELFYNTTIKENKIKVNI